MSKIISGMLTEDSTNNSTSSTFGTLQWNLVEKILLPLHSPNLMVEWRDQIPVVQVYLSHNILYYYYYHFNYNSLFYMIIICLVIS